MFERVLAAYTGAVHPHQLFGIRATCGTEKTTAVLTTTSRRRRTLMVPAIERRHGAQFQRRRGVTAGTPSICSRHLIHRNIRGDR